MSFRLALAFLCCSACSAREPAPRIAPSSASEARELDTVWVGNPDGEGPLLILLHGYGAPADDLVPLASSLRRRTDASLRVALPGAPIVMGRGRAWWPIGDGARPADRSADHPSGMATARRDLERLMMRWRTDGLSVPARTVIAGFSQGGMLAMEVGLHAEPALAGIANLSGGALNAEAWVARAPNAPPIFASHGRHDPLLAFGAAEELTRRLTRAGVEMTWLPFEGAHAIPPIVESGLGAFLDQQLANSN